MPFYRRLTAEADSSKQVDVIILGEEPEELLRKYLSQYGINGLSIVRLQSRDAKMAVTPILLLVDSSGLVRGAWRGRLDDNEESTVIKAIASQRY
jgi:hypothetical protein